ncbi:hypothetical protein ACFL1H_05710 [Nanoarchaeota archaeon]
MAGYDVDYINDIKEFSLNENTFVPIPKIYLKYVHHDNGGMLCIKSMDRINIPKKKKQSLKEKIEELIPKRQQLTPELGY